MLRIGNSAPPADTVPPVPDVPETPQDQQDTAQPGETGLAVNAKKFSADKVDPTVARYMTPDLGPFICANCEHFTQDGDCQVVSGPIDPEGVCILFTPGGAGMDEATDVQPDEPQPDQPTDDMTAGADDAGQ